MVAVWLAAPAIAHIGLEDPTPRYEDQKNGPCGAFSDERTDTVTVFEPGATITVRWEETINHPSHYRISFDEDGTDDFVDPPTMNDYYSAPSVLLDEIADADGGGFTAEVTLPDVECENCTLQVIQVMYDKPPYEPGGNDLYYQCADLALRAGAGTGTPTDGTSPPSDTGDAALTDGDGGGCGCTSAPSGWGWLSVPAVLLAVRRR